MAIFILIKMETKTGLLNEEATEKLEEPAYILKTMAHPTRLEIVHLLEQRPGLSVSAICEKLGTELSLTPHHLQNMRQKGILSARKKGRTINYSLKERDVSLIIEGLEYCQRNV